LEVALSGPVRSNGSFAHAAESGVHKTVNYLLNTYTPPGTGVDPLGNYDMTTTPVKYNGAPVVLSSNNAVAANYPVASVQTAFSTAATA
jgi:hypothetical protein